MLGEHVKATVSNPICFSSVDKADKYEVALFENGASLVKKEPKDSMIEYVNFKSETTYELKIRAMREVDKSPYYGDILTKQIPGRKFT